MNWSFRRKFLYGISALVILAIIILALFWKTIFPTATCSDGKQNGFESGVDCGGACALRCSQEVVPLTVMWSRAIPTGFNTYDVAMMVSNKNIDNTPTILGYSFVLFNEKGEAIKIVNGSTTAPLDGDFPIIRQNISSSEPIKEIIAKVIDGPHFKVNENPIDPTLRVSDIRFEAGVTPRVYATVTNTKRVVINNLPVRVVIYDVRGNAFQVGETIIPTLDKEEAKQVVYTWHQQFTDKPTKISVYPILNPFLNTK
jgi:hypothetical protein